MDGADVSPDQWREAADRALRPVPRPKLRPAAHFCRICAEEIEPERRAKLPDTGLCGGCFEETGAM